MNDRSHRIPSLKLRAVAAAFALVAMSCGALAGPGHDHGGEKVTTVSNGPQRLPDGSVFLPKPAQRQLGVRTAPVTAADLPRTTELAGKVVMDPNAGGRVQATQAGRIEPGPRGLPGIGLAVRRGETLAYVQPSVGTVERSNQSAQLADLRATKVAAEKRLARLRELVDTVPRKDIEGAEAEVSSINARITAIGGGLSFREPLVAPVTGIIASAHVVTGQVVDARELVYEIVDPHRMRVEALAYDPRLANGIVRASLVAGGTSVPLRYLGAARSLREQALPVLFQADGAMLEALAVGQPVRVFAEMRDRVRGWRVPANALTRNPSNQTIVWVKTAPEHFEPRVVTTEPLDGASVAVVSGLQNDERIAVTGAGLINQVR